MSEWKEVKLGDIAKVISGYAFKSSDFLKQSGIPVIKIKNIKNGDVDLSEVDFVDRPFLKINPKYHVNKNDILISLTGSHLTQPNSVVGRIALYRQGHTSLLNQRAGKIIPNAQKVDNQFLYAYLSQDTIREVIALRAHGAANQANISPGDVEATDVLLPPLPTQQKIASILSAFDDLIENNLKRIKLLEEIAQRTYEEWFVKFRVNGEQLAIDVTGVPAGWKMVSMLEIADFINGFAFKPTDWQSEGMPIIKIKELKNNIGPDTPRYNGNRVPQKLLITSGDILFSWSGSLEVAIWQDEDGWLNQHLFKVVPKEKESRDFVHQALLRSLSEFNSLTTGATMKHIKRKELDFVQVAKPPIPILREFEKIVKSVQNQILNIAKQTRMLKESRDILLPRLMSGEIDVEKMSIAGIASKNAGSEAKTIPFYPIKEEKEKLVAEATDVYDTKLEKDKWQFKEAVLIAVLTHKFSSEKYPLGRKRYTKLSYLFHRHAADQIARYARKAAGPYNPGTKYGGPEKIAQQNKYIVKHTNGKLEGFVASDCIADAYPYFQNYWSMDYLNWMDQFRYKKNDELELYATVDNAMIELYAKGQQVNVEAVKSIIKSEKEWAAKLEREIFSDTNIQSAIFYLPTLYAY